MVRIFFFLLGFSLLVFSFCFLIMYFNVLSIGYNFSIIVNFICRSPSSYLGLSGFLMIFFSIIIKGAKRK